MGAGNLSRRIITKETNTTLNVIINHFFVIDLNTLLAAPPTGKSRCDFKVPTRNHIKCNIFVTKIQAYLAWKFIERIGGSYAFGKKRLPRAHTIVVYLSKISGGGRPGWYYGR